MLWQHQGRQIGFDDWLPDGEATPARPPVLLLHPFPFDRRFWSDTAAGLRAAGQRVLTLDAPGFGESELKPGSLAITDLAQDALALLDARGIERVALVGLSMGGYAALALAALAAQRLAALVLADTKAGPDSSAAREGRAAALDLVATAGVPTFVDRQLERLLAPGAPATVRDRLRALGASQPAAAVTAAIVALRDRPDRTSVLTGIACPTLVLVGEQDAVTPPAEAELMAAQLPRSRLVRLPQVGHLSAAEANADFVAACLSFFAASFSESLP